MTDAVLHCQGLKKRYGDRLAVDDVGFEVAAGECYGLLGPNGAGKTTTISLICGLLDRDAGDVTVAGQPIDTRSIEARAAIGYVPQEIALYPPVSAKDNLRFFGRLYGLRGAALDGRVQAVLEAVGLVDRADDTIESYSGGMRRRANIAVGLVHRPQLLVLDEPTVGVDPQSRNAILEAVTALTDEGVAVLYTTHYMEEAERLCDRVGIIDEGRLVAEGTRRELTASVGQTDRLRLTATGDLHAFAARCRQLDGVDSADVIEQGIEVLAPDGRRLLARVVDAAESSGALVDSVEVIEPDLETVFLHLTGKALRDE
jgi:ABC-2 type transport system ATP-binding protein